MLAPEATATSVRPFHPRRATAALDARERQRARGLEHRARVLEDVLDRGADLVGVDEHHVVDVALARARSVSRAHLAHRDAVGEEVHVRQRHALARALSDWYMALESTGSTPITRVRGETRFT